MILLGNLSAHAAAGASGDDYGGSCHMGVLLGERVANSE
jgi:hypothetical protein